MCALIAAAKIIHSRVCRQYAGRGRILQFNSANMRRNVPIVGFIVGMLLPWLGFLLVYLAWFKGRDIGDVMHMLLNDKRVGPKVLTLSLLANLIPFLYTNTKRLDYAMKGVVIATMLYALLIVLIMFVW